MKPTVFSFATIKEALENHHFLQKNVFKSNPNSGELSVELQIEFKLLDRPKIVSIAEVKYLHRYQKNSILTDVLNLLPFREESNDPDIEIMVPISKEEFKLLSMPFNFLETPEVITGKYRIKYVNPEDESNCLEIVIYKPSGRIIYYYGMLNAIAISDVQQGRRILESYKKSKNSKDDIVYDLLDAYFCLQENKIDYSPACLNSYEKSLNEKYPLFTPDGLVEFKPDENDKSKRQLELWKNALEIKKLILSRKNDAIGSLRNEEKLLTIIKIIEKISNGRPDKSVEQEKLLNSLQINLINNIGEIAERKKQFIFSYSDEPLLSDTALSFKTTNLVNNQSLKFISSVSGQLGLHQPSDDQIYIASPNNPLQYVLLDDYSDWIITEQVKEFENCMIALGAKTIKLKHFSSQEASELRNAEQNAETQSVSTNQISAEATQNVEIEATGKGEVPGVGTASVKAKTVVTVGGGLSHESKHGELNQNETNSIDGLKEKKKYELTTYSEFGKTPIKLPHLPSERFWYKDDENFATLLNRRNDNDLNKFSKDIKTEGFISKIKEDVTNLKREDSSMRITKAFLNNNKISKSIDDKKIATQHVNYKINFEKFKAQSLSYDVEFFPLSEITKAIQKENVEHTNKSLVLKSDTSLATIKQPNIFIRFWRWLFKSNS